MESSLVDLSPLLRLLLVGSCIAAVPLLWVLLRHRSGARVGRWQALTVLTLFLTFDLVLFGAFTRLTDSGLGCPDWPGCYGSVSPVGAHEFIATAQSAMPTGPVTHGKAWVEMVHRYLATGVGGLILLLALHAWWQCWRVGARSSVSPWLPTLTLVWVCVQGAFGALTVTMKLFPAIVSLHLLGAYVLLALLTVQVVRGTPQALGGVSPIPRWVGPWVLAAVALLALQAASGAWVSTNYAVLACTEFPTCQGSWWPDMDFAGALELWRPLGMAQDGQHITFQALTAIHFAHRLLAMVTLTLLAVLAWQLHRVAALRKPARWLLGLLLLQLATGLANVVLGWPLLGAVLHTGGAGALLVTLVWTWATARHPFSNGISE
jgi:heme a synthase